MKDLIMKQNPVVLVGLAVVGIPTALFALFMAGLLIVCVGSLLVQAEFWQLLGAWLWSLI
ncbi:MAG: hypothetical protein IM559_10600 [Pseudanabaena sp. M151S2SP2A07QC]|nr:hypothetical protein [Pseudanabaena sp. M151S2SP2A07QC]